MKPELWTSNNESAWRRKIGMSKKDDHRAPKERNVYLRRLRGLVEQRMLECLYEKPDAQTFKERARHVDADPVDLPQPRNLTRTLKPSLPRAVPASNVIQFYDKLKLDRESLSNPEIHRPHQEFVAAGIPSPSPSSLPPLYEGNGSESISGRGSKTNARTPISTANSWRANSNSPAPHVFIVHFISPPIRRRVSSRTSSSGLPSTTRKPCKKPSPPLLPPPKPSNTKASTRCAMCKIFCLSSSRSIPNKSKNSKSNRSKNPKDLEFPIVLYKPKPPEDPEIIDAVFKVINRHPGVVADKGASKSTEDAASDHSTLLNNQ